MLARGIEPLFPRLQIECITNYARPTKNILKPEPRAGDERCRRAGKGIYHLRYKIFGSKGYEFYQVGKI
jgi:hypothetical protein